MSEKILSSSLKCSLCSFSSVLVPTHFILTSFYTLVYSHPPLPHLHSHLSTLKSNLLIISLVFLINQFLSYDTNQNLIRSTTHNSNRIAIESNIRNEGTTRSCGRDEREATTVVTHNKSGDNFIVLSKDFRKFSSSSQKLNWFSLYSLSLAFALERECQCISSF